MTTSPEHDRLGLRHLPDYAGLLPRLRLSSVTCPCVPLRLEAANAIEALLAENAGLQKLAEEADAYAADREQHTILVARGGEMIIAENDSLRERVKALTEERDHWKAMNHDSYWGQVKSLSAQVAALEKDAAQQVAWLIESTITSPRTMWWNGVPQGSGISFTSDPNDTIRFCRKQDAERVAQHMGCVEVTEHIWLDAALTRNSASETFGTSRMDE